MKNNMDELDELTKQMNSHTLHDVSEYAQVLENTQKLSIPHPSPEDWIKLPIWVKWQIVIMITWWTWQSQLAAWWLKSVCRIGRNGL